MKKHGKDSKATPPKSHGDPKAKAAESGRPITDKSGHPLSDWLPFLIGDGPPPRPLSAKEKEEIRHVEDEYELAVEAAERETNAENAPDDDPDAEYVNFLNESPTEALPCVPMMRVLAGIREDLLIPPSPKATIPPLTEASRTYFTFLALRLTYRFMAEWPWPKAIQLRREDVAKSKDPLAHDRIYFRELVETGRLANHLAYCKATVLRIPALAALVHDEWLLPDQLEAARIRPGRGLAARARKALWIIVRDMAPLLDRLAALANGATKLKPPGHGGRRKERHSSNSAARRGKGQSTKPPEPLTDKAAAVLELLEMLPPHRGRKGPDILADLDKQNPPMTFDQSTLTSRIIPELKLYGVKNRRGVGYYIDPSMRRNSAASTHS